MFCCFFLIFSILNLSSVFLCRVLFDTRQRTLCRWNLCRVFFAECKIAFAECLRHSAKNAIPVMFYRSRKHLTPEEMNCGTAPEGAGRSDVLPKAWLLRQTSSHPFCNPVSYCVRVIVRSPTANARAPTGKAKLKAGQQCEEQWLVQLAKPV
jgi:hypothetical protein